MLQRIFIGVLTVFLVWVAANIIRTRYLVGVAGGVIEKSAPFSQEGTSDKKVLILGDSVAYGTGASRPEKSVAGLVARHYFPDATVENKAENGKRTPGLASEVDDISGRYDLIFIVIGGNDILRPWLSIKDAGSNLEKIYEKAAQHSDNVIALTTGNFKYTNLFLPPLNYYFADRSVDLRDRAIVAAEKTGVNYINIVALNERQPFTPEMEAPDKLHLSDAGNQYWFEEIKRVVTDLE